MSELISDQAPTLGLGRLAEPASPAVPGASGAPGSSGGGGKAPGRTKSRRWLLFGGAGIAGLVLGGIVLFVQGGDDPLDASVASDPAPIATPATESAAGADEATDGDAQAGGTTEEAAPSTAPSTAPARTDVTSRDPFAPLYDKEQAAAADSAPAAASVAAGAAAAQTADSAGSSPMTAAAPVVTTPTPASGGTISKLKISALGNSVTLRLDGKKYTVAEGETFATSYRLYDIFNAECAGFLYGDQNAVVCEGDSTVIG